MIGGRKESATDFGARGRKIAATKAAKAEQFKNQVIRVDDNWRIARADVLNWEVQYQGNFYGYFGDLLSAFKALPGKMLKESAKGTLAEVLECQRGIMASIEMALEAL
jgi:hypothetical protein